MNSRQTRVGRKNQLLYALSTLDAEWFDAKAVETQIRRSFPKTTTEKALNIAGMLSEIESTKDAPIRRILNSNRYRFADPKVKMAMRAMLVRKDDEGVEAKYVQDAVDDC